MCFVNRVCLGTIYSLAANGQKRPYFFVSSTEIYFRLNLIYCKVKTLGVGGGGHGGWLISGGCI